jgi:hypothetical protein
MAEETNSPDINVMAQRLREVERQQNKIWEAVERISRNGETLIRLEGRVEELFKILESATKDGFNRCGIHGQAMSDVVKRLESFDSGKATICVERAREHAQTKETLEKAIAQARIDAEDANSVTNKRIDLIGKLLWAMGGAFGLQLITLFFFMLTKFIETMPK